MKRIQPTKTWGVVLLAVCLIAFVALGVSTIVKHNNTLRFKTIELQDTSTKLKLLQQQYDVQLKSKDVDQQKLRDLEKQKEDLEKQLSVKQEAKRVADAQAAEAQLAAQRLANAVTQTKTAYAAPASPGGAKGFIYAHESGNRTDAVNSIGACGLGQALPCSKMPCTLHDYGCQDNFFTGYMQNRYGSWEAAQSFWISHARWNGHDWIGGWW